MREQAALAATEITADTVNDFVADLKDGGEYEQTFSRSSPNKRKSIWEKMLAIATESTSTERKHDLLPVRNTSDLPKINGKYNKIVQKMCMKINGNPMTRDDAFTEFIYGKIPTYKEVLPGLESWKAGKIALWHHVEGNSIMWFCVVCIDRKGNNLLSLSIRGDMQPEKFVLYCQDESLSRIVQLPCSRCKYILYFLIHLHHSRYDG